MMHLFVFQQLVFLVCTLVLLALDYLLPSQYKIQPQQKRSTISLNWQEICWMIGKNVYLISLPIGFVFLQFVYTLDPLDWSLPRVCFDQLVRLASCVLIQEVAFYYIHRLMHQPTFYPRVHKFHHQVISPNALDTLYVDPIEHVLLNLMPVLISPWLTGLQGQSLYMWFALVTISSTVSHSGLTWFGRASRFHDQHHKTPNVNFGVLGLLDRLHSTDYKRQMNQSNQSNNNNNETVGNIPKAKVFNL